MPSSSTHHTDTSPTTPPPSLRDNPKSGTTLLADIRSLLNNEELTDILLVPTANSKSRANASDTSNSNNNNSVGEEEDDASQESYMGEAIEGIPAIKALLAARSPVFRRMLYGDFREKRGSNNNNGDDEVLRVKLDYSANVLRLLVEFCFTDRLDSLENRENNSHGREDEECSNDSRVTDDNTNNEPLSTTARLLTSLSSAAHYFDIPKLEHDIVTRLNEIMSSHPSLACVVLDEGSKIMQEELCERALDRIRARPKAALLPYDCDGEMHRGGVVALSASLLERVVFDDVSNASELTKFHCLQRWVEGCLHDVVDEEEVVFYREDDDGEDVNEQIIPYTSGVNQHASSSTIVNENDNNNLNNNTNKTNQDQKRLIASHLAQKLDLSLIPASDLDTVSHSNLLSHQDLFKAYRLQALNAERTKSKVFVEGAGLAEINGTYIQGGMHEGIPMYNKEGVWRDREEVFRIFLCTYSNGNKSWCISIVPKGKEPGKTTDVDFYENPVTYGGKGPGPYNGVSENGLGVVPSRGWKLVNFGQPPTPKCSLIAGVSSD